MILSLLVSPIFKKVGGQAYLKNAKVKMQKSKLGNRNRGFTLIELLVVVAIIGLLSSIIGTTVSVSRSRSKDAKRVSDMKQIKSGMDLFFSTASGYPSQAVWNANIAQTLTCNGTPFFIVPRDPGAYQYVYDNPSSSTAFDGPCGTVYSEYQIIFTIERTGNSYIMNEDGNVYTDNSGVPGTPVSFDSLL